MELWKIKNRVRYNFDKIFRMNCPACRGSGGWGDNYNEPFEECGYCKGHGRLFPLKAWEWTAFIEKDHLAPSDWPRHIWYQIVDCDCPEPDGECYHLGCKVCGGTQRIRRIDRLLKGHRK